MEYMLWSEAMGWQHGDMERAYERKTEWQKEDTEWNLYPNVIYVN